MAGKNKKETDTIKVSRQDLFALVAEIRSEPKDPQEHPPFCPLNMTSELVESVKVLPEITPALKKLADNTDDIIAAGKLYAEGKKSIWNFVKALVIIGILSAFFIGLAEKFKSLFK